MPWDAHKDKHHVTYADINYRTPYAWVLRNPIIYPEPIPYNYPQGAVIWVKLPDFMEGGQAGTAEDRIENQNRSIVNSVFDGS
ncbi:hypothetical protein D3C72_2467110 [compost metagenome]